MTGQKIKHYEIREPIGRGAMGAVYRAYDTALNRDVAIKVLSPMAAPRPSDVNRFYQEARAAAGLSHPNVVVIHDIGQHENVPYFVMELLSGRSLRTALEANGRMPWRESFLLGIQICRALELAHEKGVLHRDIKPDNVWLHSDGRVVVLDFGLARFSTANSLTQAGETMGTPEYMAPEQIMGDPLDGRVDQYALGIVLYELLTGQPPFTGPNPITVVYKQMEEEPLPPGQRVSDVPVIVEQVVLKAISKDPHARYASACQFREALEAVLHGKEPDAEAAEVLDIAHESSEEELQFHCRMVGREAEFLQLQTAVDTICGGQGETVLISGEAGVGKTRLASEALAFARKKGALVLEGVCLASEGAEPYLPFLEALRQGLDFGGDVVREKVAAFVRQEAPELETVTRRMMTEGWVKKEAGAGNEDMPIASTQERFFEAVTQVLLFISHHVPVVLLLDDLHWADSGSLQLLHYLSRNAKRHRLLIMGTYRTEDLLPEAEGALPLLVDTMQKMSREKLFEKITLAGLNKSDLGKMVHLIFRRARFGDEFFASLYQESGGNPFFALEVLQLLRDEGIIVARRGIWRASKEITRGDIPERVYDVVVRRINRLTEKQRELLQVASVEGEQFSSEMLALVVGQKRLQVLQELNRLSRVHQLIQPGDKGYIFSHAKIREVLYNEITPELRQVYHLGYATGLEAHNKHEGNKPVVDLARHFYLGRDPKRALPYLMRAGERATQSFAYKEARDFYLWALDALKDAQQLENEGNVRYELGRIYRYLGDVQSTWVQFEKVEMLARQHGDFRMLAKTLWEMGIERFKAGEYRDAVEKYKQSAEYFQKIGDQKMLVNVLIDTANIPFEQGDWQHVEAYYAKALRSVRMSGNKWQLATIFMNLGIMATIRGKPDRALALYEKSRPIFEELQHWRDLARLWLNQGWTLAGQKRWIEAQDAYEQALILAQKTHFLEQEANCHLNLAEVLLEISDLVACKRSCLRALELFEKVNFQAGLAEVLKTLGQVTTRERKWQESRAYFARSISIYEDRKQAMFAGQAHREFARMLKEAGELNEAEVAVNRAMDWLQKADSKSDLQDAETLKKEIDGLTFLAKT